MFVAGKDRRTVIITDWRLKTDADLDASEPGQGHVLELYKFARWCLGRAYLNVTRIALFDYQAKPGNAEAAKQREALVAWLAKYKPGRVYIIPTPDSTMGAEANSLKGTQCWNALRAPDTLDAMRGTRWLYNGHSEVTALYPIAKRVKELHRWSAALWLRARGLHTLHLVESRLCITPSLRMLKMLDSMVGKPLSIDLEFNPSNDIVTAVGLSDGHCAVSIPWDRYLPRNNEEWEPGLKDYKHLYRDIRKTLAKLLAAPTAKVAHNFVADIPRLTKRGFKVGGILHDTFAAHAIAFPELRHGLQHAAASMLPVPPWKSLYKPQHISRGITRDDAEFWIADPLALRSYNCRDAFYTWHLAKAVLPHVGAHLE